MHRLRKAKIKIRGNPCNSWQKTIKGYTDLHRLKGKNKFVVIRVTCLPPGRFVAKNYFEGIKKTGHGLHGFAQIEEQK